MSSLEIRVLWISDELPFTISSVLRSVSHNIFTCLHLFASPVTGLKQKRWTLLAKLYVGEAEWILSQYLTNSGEQQIMEVNWDRKREGTWSQHWSLEKNWQITQAKNWATQQKGDIRCSGTGKAQPSKICQWIVLHTKQMQRSNMLKQSKSLKEIF